MNPRRSGVLGPEDSDSERSSAIVTKPPSDFLREGAEVAEDAGRLRSAGGVLP